MFPAVFDEWQHLGNFEMDFATILDVRGEGFRWTELVYFLFFHTTHCPHSTFSTLHMENQISFSDFTGKRKTKMENQISFSDFTGKRKTKIENQILFSDFTGKRKTKWIIKFSFPI